MRLHVKGKRVSHQQGLFPSFPQSALSPTFLGHTPEWHWAADSGKGSVS